MSAPVKTTNLPGFPRHQGKVRDIYDLGDRLLLIATDRIAVETAAFTFELQDGFSFETGQTCDVTIPSPQYQDAEGASRTS